MAIDEDQKNMDNNPSQTTEKRLKVRKKRQFIFFLLGLVILLGLSFLWQKAKETSVNNSSSALIKQANSTTGGNNHLAQKNAASSQAPANANLTQSYNNTTLGFTIKYPNDWIYDLQSDGTMTFSGKDGTPAFNSTITIEQVSGSNLDSTLSSLKSDYTGDANAKAQISNEKDYTYSFSDGTKVQGKSFEVNFSDPANNTSYHDDVIVVPKGNQYFVWTYSSPSDQYDTYNATNQAMLGSWVINK